MDINESKKITYLLVICALAFIIFGSSIAYAWLTINASVTQEGLQITTKVLPSLVISDSKTDILKKSLDNSSSFTITRSFDKDIKFLPCTHYDTLSSTSPAVDNPARTFSTLKFLKNTGEVDQKTGLAPRYEYVSISDPSVTEDSIYCVKKTVYIASAKDDFNGVNLIATMSATYKTEENQPSSYENDELDSFNAASIDFYVNGTFIGTLNKAGLDAKVNDGSTNLSSLTLISNNSITTTSYYTIDMVFYFDGSLLKTSGQAYVATKTAKADFAVVDITFSIQ